MADVDADLCVLVTGFAPFGDDPYNPSGAAAKALDGARVGGEGERTARVVGRGDLPVRFGDESDNAADALLQAIVEARPDVVICLGQGDDLCFRVELCARDNVAHHDPRIATTSADYREAYATGLDADAMVAALRAAGGDAMTSDDAGSYVCEDVFYHLMRYVAARPKGVDVRAAGFIHVPRYVEADGGAVPNAPMEAGETPVKQSVINEAIRKAVEAAVAGG